MVDVRIPRLFIIADLKMGAFPYLASTKKLKHIALPVLGIEPARVCYNGPRESSSPLPPNFPS
jgi:hypothetical protein